MFTPSLPNIAACQIVRSRNNAIIFMHFLFSRSEICLITPSRFPLGGSSPKIGLKRCFVLSHRISRKSKCLNYDDYFNSMKKYYHVHNFFNHHWRKVVDYRRLVQVRRTCLFICDQNLIEKNFIQKMFE